MGGEESRSLAATHAAFRATRSFGSLDGLRCVSILAVLWHHTRPNFAFPPAVHNGFLGVDLFFVISGFLIASLLLRERDTSGQISLLRFYARRSLRIFPPYYGLLAALSLVLLLGPPTKLRAPFFEELPFYLSYTSNWIPTHTLLGISWSLAAEEQFYLLWPPVLRLLRRHALTLLAGFVALNQLVNFRVGGDFVARALGLEYADLAMLQATFTPICIGVALAHGLHAQQSHARIAALAGWSAAPLVFAALLFALCNVPGDIAGAPRLAIQLAMGALVASCVLREEHALARILRWRPFRHVGAISYGIYLYHLLVLVPVDAALARLPGAPGLSRFLLCSLAAVGVADLSYRLWERPFLRWKQRFAAPQ